MEGCDPGWYLKAKNGGSQTPLNIVDRDTQPEEDVEQLDVDVEPLKIRLSIRTEIQYPV